MRKHLLGIHIAILAAGLGLTAPALGQAPAAQPQSAELPTQTIGEVVEGEYEPTLLRANDSYEMWQYGHEKVMFFDVECMWLKRNLSDRVPLAETGGSTNIFMFQWEPGLRATLGLQSSNQTAWEISYFGLIDWRDSISVLQYDAEMNNAEINWRRHYDIDEWTSASTLIGVRYLNLQEHFVVDTADCRTTNNVFGLQAGGDYEEFFGPLSCGIRGSIGLMGNVANQQTLDTALSVYDSAGTVAGLFDVGLFGTVSLTESVIIRFGYQAMFITSLALAPEQFLPSTTGSGNINTSGLGIYHGPNIGLLWFWGKPRF